MGGSASTSEFCEQLQDGFDVYIPRECLVKSHSCPWFSAACAAAIAKGFLKLPNLHMLITQEFITSQKPGSQDFWQIANSILSNGKSAIPPVFNGLEMLSFASDKAQLFAKNFFKDSNLDNLGTSAYFPFQNQSETAYFYNSQDG